MTERDYRISKLTIEITTMIIVAIIGYFLVRLVNKNDSDHSKIEMKLDKITDRQDDSQIDRLIIKQIIVRHWPEEKDLLFPRGQMRGGNSSQTPNQLINKIQYVPEETQVAGR